MRKRVEKYFWMPGSGNLMLDTKCWIRDAGYKDNEEKMEGWKEGKMEGWKEGKMER